MGKEEHQKQHLKPKKIIGEEKLDL